MAIAPLRRVRATAARPFASDGLRTVVIVGTVVLVFYLVIVPLFFLLFGSVWTGRPGQEGALSLGAYAEIISNPNSYRLLGISVAYGLGATTLSFLFGVTVAWLLHRTDVPGKPLWIFIVLLPLFVPGLLFTIGWILLLDPTIGMVNTFLQDVFGFQSGPIDLFSFYGMVWVKGIDGVPLVALWLWPAFAAMDPGLEEAGAAAGARPSRVLRTLTLPLMRPALLAAFVIAFVSTLEDLSVPALIGLPDRILVFASEIWLATARSPTDIHRASAYATVLLGITIVLVVLYRRLTLHYERYVVVRGRGYTPSLMKLGGMRWPTAVLLGLVLFTVIVLPLLLLLWMSLQPFTRIPSVEAIQSLTLKHFNEMFTNPLLFEGLRNSIVLGVGTAIAVMALALVIGWIVVRTRSRLGYVIDLISFAPIAIPGLVVGIAFMWLYLTLRLPIAIYGTLLILLIAYVTRLLPFGVRLAYAGFAQVHPELEEVAATSGSPWGRTMRKISLPLLAPTVVVGMIYVFVRAFGEIPSSLLLFSFGNRTYSVVAFNMWFEGKVQATAAYGVIAVAVMLVVAIILYAFGERGRALRQ
jgi:iron(III) transport system permease protein